MHLQAVLPPTGDGDERALSMIPLLLVVWLPDGGNDINGCSATRVAAGASGVRSAANV